ncbi:fimbrillin family protein [Bacteroides sp.]|uniref:fimbrillin family protein n=1 Tax=Bacteroides sp. TaxID=29523 RepID=UPI0026272F7F|nr:fimbrillin family protein [Bacteroides sp.]MDD3039249.1 fimbrillin family protein [Bacteroides sp.]
MNLFVKHLAGTILLLTSCSNYTEEELLVNVELPVPVQLTVAEVNPHTRAVVNNIGDISVSSLGIYEVAEGKTPGTFPWSVSPLLNNTPPSSISGNQLSFSPRLYYPMGGQKIIFYGYYPRTTATSGANYVTPPSSGNAPTFNFTLTGQEDIMYAVSTPSGSTTPGAAVSLTFNHKLTQIQLNTSILGSLLTSVKITNVKNTGSMNLETGAITYGNSVTDISFTKASLTATNPLMVPADVSSYILEASILGLLAPRKYLIKPTSGNFLAGTIYTISIN